MEEELNVKKKSSKKLIIVLLMFVVVAAVIGAIVIIKIKGDSDSDKEDGILEYEANVIVDDPADFQAAMDEMAEKAKEGQMSLHMQTEAYSKDGKTFSCFLANSEKNNYDMFMVFYDDETQEEIYRTGLIPIGARIEEFVLEKPLTEGNHSITIVFNQVEEDKKTIHSQVNVGLTLIVQ